MLRAVERETTMQFDQPAWWFLAAAAALAYTYAIYPLTVAALAALRRRETLTGGRPRSVSIVLAVRDEAAVIERRLRELTTCLVRSGLPGEIIVVSDGSSDATVSLARGFPDGRVRVIDLPRGEGKARALSEGCAAATGEAVVFADARQRWPREALANLLQPLADPGVGAVSGTLVLESAGGGLAGVRLYWGYETWLRHNESRLHSTIGVSGSISTVRRRLFAGIPDGTVLDDVYWPMRVALQGYRVLHARDAVAYDALPARARDEFRRKVRTLGGNFQLLGLLPQVIVPWRNPVWWQFVSHKLLRLAVPWMLLVLLVSSGLSDVPVLGSLFWLQLAGYAAGGLGLLAGASRAGTLLSPFASFVLLNAAAWVAFWVWISGKSSGSWARVDYGPQPPESGAP